LEYISYDTKTNKKIIHDINDIDNNVEAKNIYNNITETKLEDDFKELAEKTQGYPSVYVVMIDDEEKMIKNALVEHGSIFVNDDNSKKNTDKEAAISLNEILDKGIEALKSDSKKIFIHSNIPKNELKRKQPSNKYQVAGGIVNGKKCGDLCSIEKNDKNDKNYELKYLKYKSKYLELKKKLNN